MSVETVEAGQPRGAVSVVLVGLLLGPAAVMLWLGKGRLAVLFILAVFVAMLPLLVLMREGYIWPLVPDWLKIIDNFDVWLLPLSVAGVAYALFIRKSALARPWFSRWYVALPAVPVLSLLIAGTIRAFLFQPFNAPSGSMIPSLQVGDYFFVSKPAYGFSKYSFPLGLVDFTGRFGARQPERGDIVVFRHPRDADTEYVKRLIGLPRERIQMIDGVLHIDGTAVKLEPESGAAIPCIWDQPCQFFRETLPNGRSYVINDTVPDGVADNTPEYLVPEGTFFFLGDNRDNSIDSRFDQMGTVPFDNLIGPARIIFWNERGDAIDERLKGYPP